MTAQQRRIEPWPGWVALGIAVLLFFPTTFLVGSIAVGYAAIVLYLAGGYWIGVAGNRVLGHGFLFAAVALSLSLKLFTAEVLLPGDPTVGVILKDHISLVSVVDHPNQVAAPPFTFIYGPSDNQYGAEAFYRPVVTVGWIAAPVVWLLAWASWIPLARLLNLNVPFPRRRKGWRRPKGTRKRLIHYGLGYGFVFLGVLGLFLPILQGILFLVVGFVLLARVSPRVRLQRMRLRRRYPKWAARYDKWEDLAKDWLKGRFRMPWTARKKGEEGGGRR